MSSASKLPNKDVGESISKLKTKLRELFQLDRGDLDFGLYRIMAIKSAEVGDFLDNHLLPQIKETLGDIAKSDTSLLETDLKKALEEARKHIPDPETSSTVKELREQIKAAKIDQQTEADVYNHLCNFFSRYYDEGDFMSLRRYKGAGKEAYSIPYNGEEVKLHWANADQYYIKTTENYSSYAFIVGKGSEQRRVRFEIAAANNEKDNIKETNGNKRFFVLAKDFIAEKEKTTATSRELIIRFDHRPLTEGEKTKYPQNGIKRQSAINEDAEQRILKKLKGDWTGLIFAPCPTEANGTRTLLSKHITAYTAKNSFDYFIHKDLGGFLRRELDSYLKSEVISIDNLELADDPTVFIRNLAQLKAIKRVGGKIIDFLAQLEDFQKQLWLKKKFVLETQYCVTLDKVPESLYAEIIKNEAQHNEWIKLFAIDELKGDAVATAYSKPLKSKFLKENPYLVLDTRHFDGKFTDELLAALSEAGLIEEQMNGLLVHGENFQALNLMQERYRGQVKCIYIDPPYNAKTSEILYKNNYKHSAWLSMMNNRILYSKDLLNRDNGVFICAIDENEVLVLGMLFDTIFSGHERNILSVLHNPKGIQGGFVSVNNEYAYTISPPGTTGNQIFIPEKDRKWENFRNWGGESERNTAKNCFYPIIIKNSEVIGFGDVCDENFHPPKNVNQNDGSIYIFPVDNNGVERKWTWARQTVESIRHLLRAVNKNGNWDIEKSWDSKRFKTVWSRSEYIAGDYGSKPLNHILGGKFFDFPKAIPLVSDSVRLAADPDSIILDYFAGSGTTAHAVINLNRQDRGKRSYILAEIGHHFETVLLPRTKKVIYSKDWKDGKPEDRKGVSQLFRYIRLESYEDTLDGLTVKPRKDLLEAEQNEKFIEDYQLRYMLGEETAESASLLGQDFIDPFNYTLSVVRDGVRHDVKVDIAETFNFLLGLRLAGRRQIDEVLAITGTTPKGENCLVLWRNLKTMDAPKLDKWFNKHRKSFDDDLNLIYVNGDHTLNALKQSTDKWEAVTTEPIFRELMFSGTE